MASKLLAFTLTCPSTPTFSTSASRVLPIQFNAGGRHSSIRRDLLVLSPKATSDQQGLIL